MALDPASAAVSVPASGQRSRGQRADVFRLGGEPGVSLEVLTTGAAVRRLEVSGLDGRRRNVVLGHFDAGDYARPGPYLGATVGRYANRIAGAQFALHGRHFQLTGNDRGHNLHGGPAGFDIRTWDVVSAGDQHAVLELISPDGDQGFPGTLTARASYTVDGDTVTIEYTATTDAPTLVNLTSHTYWNLDGEDAGSIDDHELTVPAGQYTPVDQESIPLGEHASVAGTPFDFRSPGRLGPATRAGHPQIRAARGIDHNFVIPGSGLRKLAVLRSQRSGIQLIISSDQPGLQIYTGNHLDGSQRSTSGALYRQGAGIALEPQHFPDSPHHPEWPSTVLRPGERYRTVTQLQLQAL